MSRMVNRLSVVFGIPETTTDPAAFVAEMSRLVKAYSDAEQDKAADILISSFSPTQRKPWPAPWEISDACVEARRLVNPPVGETTRHPEWTRERVAEAYRLIRSPIGRTAADEGWVLSAWDFARRHRRLPANPAEIEKCKASARKFDQTFAECERGTSLLAQVFCALGETMLRRRNKLAGVAYGELTSDEEMGIDRKMAAAGEAA